MNKTTNTADTRTHFSPIRVALAQSEKPAPGNDNAASLALRNEMQLAAHPEVVRSIRLTLQSHRVHPQDMADAIADVQLEAIEAARARPLPRKLARWKALAITTAVHWALDRHRRARQRGKYDTGLCEDPDAYLSPTLYWEHRDPVDTKRYLAILEELFEAGEMPELGEEILQAEADEVPHEEIAAELGLTTSVVHGRLFRMREKFYRRLAALGMLALLLFVFALPSPSDEVAAPPPQTAPVPEPPPTCSDPPWDGGIPPLSLIHI